MTTNPLQKNNAQSDEIQNGRCVIIPFVMCLFFHYSTCVQVTVHVNDHYDVQSGL